MLDGFSGFDADFVPSDLVSVSLADSERRAAAATEAKKAEAVIDATHDTLVTDMMVANGLPPNDVLARRAFIRQQRVEPTIAPSLAELVTDPRGVPHSQAYGQLAISRLATPGFESVSGPEALAS